MAAVAPSGRHWADLSDAAGNDILTSEGKIDWGAGGELLTAEFKAEAFRIFAARKFTATEAEHQREEMPELRVGAPSGRPDNR